MAEEVEDVDDEAAAVAVEEEDIVDDDGRGIIIPSRLLRVKDDTLMHCISSNIMWRRSKSLFPTLTATMLMVQTAFVVLLRFTATIMVVLWLALAWVLGRVSLD